MSLENLVRNSNDRTIQLRDSIENALIKRLDVLGHRLSIIQEKNINTLSEHAYNIQQVVGSPALYIENTLP